MAGSNDEYTKFIKEHSGTRKEGTGLVIVKKDASKILDLTGDGTPTEAGDREFYIDREMLTKSILWSSAGAAGASFLVTSGISGAYPTVTLVATGAYTVASFVHTFGHKF